jgi:cell wall-associated NlpC family hydrolase
MKKMPLFLGLLPLFSWILTQETTWAQETTLAAAAPAAETIMAETASAGAADDAPELDIEAFLRGRIAEIAQRYLGVAYKYAGITPEGFDCSGFVYFVFHEAAGMELSRSTTALWKSGKAVKLAEVRPGDLLVFTTVKPGASHVGIVLENSKEKGIIFVHAASQGAKVGVIVSGLNESYYKARVMGARNYF